MEFNSRIVKINNKWYVEIPPQFYDQLSPLHQLLKVKVSVEPIPEGEDEETNVKIYRWRVS